MAVSACSLWLLTFCKSSVLREIILQGTHLETLHRCAVLERPLVVFKLQWFVFLASKSDCKHFKYCINNCIQIIKR